LHLKRSPAAIQFGNVVDGGLDGTDSKRRQFRNELRYSYTSLRRTPLQRSRRAVIDFDRLGFHGLMVAQNEFSIQALLAS